jgi:hypothetical protein
MMMVRLVLRTHRVRQVAALGVLGFALCALLSDSAISAEKELIARDLLIADVRQLASILETAHPDPYLSVGGKIAFHQRLRDVLASIPDTGMTATDLLDLLRPLVASLGDSHTMLRSPTAEGQSSPGLPLELKIIEQGLYVAGVYGHAHKHLLGARLVAIEGIALPELLRRQSRERGLENFYTRLAILSRTLRNSRRDVRRLVPEWQDSASIRISFEFPSGQRDEYSLPLVVAAPDSLVRPETARAIPSTAHSDVVYEFLDSRHMTALLVIADMMRYREGCEGWYAKGLSEAQAFTQEAYRHFHGDSLVPEDKDSLLAAIPAATDAFVNLVVDMKRAGTKTLIVDLRENTGGNSVMLNFLLYFLYGDSTMKNLRDSYTIKKLSPLYFEVYANDSLAKINEGRAIPLAADDYVFEDEPLNPGESITATPDSAAWSGMLRDTPTFRQVYQRGTYGWYYRPEKIVVLCSPFTFSSGFNLMAALYKLGALLVGTPSAQAGNNFGDSLPFALKHSGINGFVSHKRVITFPDDAEKGNCLKPDVLLTYKKLAAYGFDPNAELRLALEALKNTK